MSTDEQLCRNEEKLCLLWRKTLSLWRMIVSTYSLVLKNIYLRYWRIFAYNLWLMDNWVSCTDEQLCPSNERSCQKEEEKCPNKEQKWRNFFIISVKTNVRTYLNIRYYSIRVSESDFLRFFSFFLITSVMLLDLYTSYFSM